ncbi:unnamed protein product [Closterium sp. NIES-65]|nr:unnamed protein product [Closterium sp. NIES-65]
MKQDVGALSSALCHPILPLTLPPSPCTPLSNASSPLLSPTPLHHTYSPLPLSYPSPPRLSPTHFPHPSLPPLSPMHFPHPPLPPPPLSPTHFAHPIPPPTPFPHAFLSPLSPTSFPHAFSSPPSPPPIPFPLAFCSPLSPTHPFPPRNFLTPLPVQEDADLRVKPLRFSIPIAIRTSPGEHSAASSVHHTAPIRLSCITSLLSLAPSHHPSPLSPTSVHSPVSSIHPLPSLHPHIDQQALISTLRPVARAGGLPSTKAVPGRCKAKIPTLITVAFIETLGTSGTWLCLVPPFAILALAIDSSSLLNDVDF